MGVDILSRGNNVIVGKIGESIASDFLKKRGYKILQKNFRTPFGEIDIVAKEKEFLVFVEVKTRITYSLGSPHLSITKSKERHIIRNALFYLRSFDLADPYWRIDIVSIKIDHLYNLEKLEIIKNAVQEE